MIKNINSILFPSLPCGVRDTRVRGRVSGQGVRVAARRRVSGRRVQRLRLLLRGHAREEVRVFIFFYYSYH